MDHIMAAMIYGGLILTSSIMLLAPKSPATFLDLVKYGECNKLVQVRANADSFLSMLCDNRARLANSQQNANGQLMIIN